MSKTKPNNEQKQSFFDKIENGYLYFFLIAVLFITLIIFYKPIAIDGLDPAGADKLAGIGKMHQVREYRDRTGEPILWNPNIFCGVPKYFTTNSRAFNLNKLFSFLNQNGLDWRVGWFLFGAIGMFLLLRKIGIPWYISLVGTAAFIFWPHFQGLVEVGHNTKIRAVCAMPWVVFSFINYVKKRNIISVLWFTLLFSLQFRTKHYQIVFYTLLVILFLGIYYIVKWVKEKEYKRLGKTVPLFLGAMIFSILMSAQPIFVAGEYTPYSTRGGNAIDLNEKPKAEAKKSGGVTFDYATQWSFGPKEMMALVSPRFFGGTSNEMYTGDSEPRLSGRKLPTYWGDMPFTQSTEYIGIIIAVLAIYGFWANRKNGLVITFGLLALFSLLLSFGQHFAPLYKLFFYYLPYFDKFRAPVMTLILFAFNIFILSMYGIKSLIAIDNKEKLKPFAIIAGFFAILGLLFIIAPNMLSYSGVKDGRMNPQLVGMLKNIRKEMMIADTLRMLFFLAAFVALFVLFYLKKIKKELLISGIFILVSVDAIAVSYRFMKNAEFFNRTSAERRYFRKTKFDRIIEKDNAHNRILELGQGFQSNDLAYRHQLIGGYSAIKPQLIQDIVDNNLYKGPNPQVPINFSVINMLNGKYIITPGQVKLPNLELLAVDKEQKKALYRNNDALNRVFFVEQTQKLASEKAVVRFMNTPTFNPDSIALFSDDELREKRYNTAATAEITTYTPTKISITAETSGESFMVLSEAYFPIGWTCKVDGVETPIYQVNHILRGIELTSGTHEIVFTFKPSSYKQASFISLFSTYLAWIGLIVLYLLRYKETILSRFQKNK